MASEVRPAREVRVKAFESIRLDKKNNWCTADTTRLREIEETLKRLFFSKQVKEEK